ncbi:MAG: metal ABC transporter substrate-binding protein [Gemmataceae bacterium]|nr:metal ABC transporter substrate-binding protein [Gemmataceae bacterium]MCI0743008.1 metal ABC transporter substrate-binding protein [Gemmataceae bacterium]
MRRAAGATLILGSVLLLVVYGCSKADDAWPETGKKRVLASFPPLYCFAKQVAGDDADVRCLLTSTGPHDYQPTMRDVFVVRKAHLFLTNGLELDDFVTKLAEDTKNRTTKLVKLGNALPSGKLLPMDHEGHDHDGHHHHHGEHDPHVWLHPEIAAEMVRHIANLLGEIDPANKDKYQERAKEQDAEFAKLLAYGQAAFKGKKNRKIITMHESLRYFAQAFGLEVMGSVQLRPGIEGDARSITTLVQKCKEKGVGAICIEPQYPKNSAEVVQAQLKKQGLDVQLVEVDPLETAPAATGNSNPDPRHYLERMYRNIDNLAKALP